MDLTFQGTCAFMAPEVWKSKLTPKAMYREVAGCWLLDGPIGRIQCGKNTCNLFSLKIMGRLFFCFCLVSIYFWGSFMISRRTAESQYDDDGCFCETDLKHLCFDYVPTDPWIIWTHWMSLVL